MTRTALGASFLVQVAGLTNLNCLNDNENIFLLYPLDRHV